MGSATNSTVVDLSLVDVVEFAIAKLTETLVITCVKGVDGIVYVPFTSTDLDEVGSFYYDVQVTWTDTTKTTFKRDKIKVLDDVNKT